MNSITASKNSSPIVTLFFKKPVIVLIDEYDSPMIEAFSKGYYNEMADFMRSWLGA